MHTHILAATHVAHSSPRSVRLKKKKNQVFTAEQTWLWVLSKKFSLVAFKFPRFWQTCWGSCRDDNVWEMWGRRGDDSLPPQYSPLQHVWVREDIQPSGWGGTCDKDEVRRQMRHSVRHDGTWEHVRFLSAKDFGGTRRTDLSQQSSSSTTCFTKRQQKKKTQTQVKVDSRNTWNTTATHTLTERRRGGQTEIIQWTDSGQFALQRIVACPISWAGCCRLNVLHNSDTKENSQKNSLAHRPVPSLMK